MGLAQLEGQAAPSLGFTGIGPTGIGLSGTSPTEINLAGITQAARSEPRAIGERLPVGSKATVECLFQAGQTGGAWIGQGLISPWSIRRGLGPRFGEEQQQPLPLNPVVLEVLPEQLALGPVLEPQSPALGAMEFLLQQRFQFHQLGREQGRGQGLGPPCLARKPALIGQHLGGHLAPQTQGNCL